MPLAGEGRVNMDARAASIPRIAGLWRVDVLSPSDRTGIISLTLYEGGW